MLITGTHRGLILFSEQKNDFAIFLRDKKLVYKKIDLHAPRLKPILEEFFGLKRTQNDSLKKMSAIVVRLSSQANP